MQVNPRQSCTLDSLLGIPDSKRWRDSGFLEWNHGSQSPGFRTLQAKKKSELPQLGRNVPEILQSKRIFLAGKRWDLVFSKSFILKTRKVIWDGLKQCQGKEAVACVEARFFTRHPQQLENSMQSSISGIKTVYDAGYGAEGRGGYLTFPNYSRIPGKRRPSHQPSEVIVNNNTQSSLFGSF